MREKIWRQSMGPALEVYFRGITELGQLPVLRLKAKEEEIRRG